MSLDTVYRTLALFESHGILARLWGPDGRCRFDPNRTPHHHLMCRRCYQIKDFMWPGFDELGHPPGVSQWGEVSRVQVVVHGLCAECLRKGRLGGKGLDAESPSRAGRAGRGQPRAIPKERRVL